jgi:hypothetical protein
MGNLIKGQIKMVNLPKPYPKPVQYGQFDEPITILMGICSFWPDLWVKTYN